jgi:arylsulfatase A-like enzyme
LTTGVFVNDVHFNPEAQSLGKVFKMAGYQTAYIGKWHLDGHGRNSFIPVGRRQGFDYWKVLECTHDYNNSFYWGNDDKKSKWEGYDAFAQTADAVNYITTRKLDNRPFLMILSWDLLIPLLKLLDCA